MTDVHVPALEMLWEAVDPRAALEERFGFGDGSSAARWVAATLREHWDLCARSPERIVISDRNALAWVTTPTGGLLLKWSVALPRFKRLSGTARLTHWLGAQGLPVSPPVPSTDGRLHVETEDALIVLQRLVEGDLLDVEDADQVRAAGATLARLHQALAHYPDTDRIVPPHERPEPLADRIDGWLGSAGDHVPVAATDTLRRLLEAMPADDLPTQVVHGDYRASNILCTGTGVAAVIDFEEARLDHCVDELARSAVMLGTRFRDWGPVSAEVRGRFRSGYESVRRLTPVEDQWWDTLVLWYSLVLLPPQDDPTGWGRAALSQVEELTTEP